MNAMELMREIQSRRIFVHLDEGRLRVEAPVGALTDDIKLALTAHKAGLIAALSQTCAEDEPPIRSTARASESPMSFAQQRLWFLEQFVSDAASYVIPAAFRFIGSLNIAALSWAVNAIVARHETLRTRFSVVDGEATQIVAPS
ncbi:condensation domain-containing protein, partial [Methylosinus sp. LW4]|uniref:condensation domain-containing protein n=1 Tax=Methylosinus sp. LW4 TaxID=136993 RepID=UPI0005B80384